MSSTVENDTIDAPAKHGDPDRDKQGVQSDLFDDTTKPVELTSNASTSLSDYDTRNPNANSSGEAIDSRAMPAKLGERIMNFYHEYPRLSAAFLASLIIHTIVIFYMPPELITLMFGPPGNAQTQRPIAVTLKGDISKLTQNEQDGDQDSAEQGKFMGGGDGKWSDLLKRLDENANLTQSFPQKYEDLLDNEQVGDSYIYRERHHQDIVVKEVFPTIYEIEKPFKDILAAAPKQLDDYLERNEVIDQYRDWRMGKPDQPLKLNISGNLNGKVKKGPLNFPKNERAQFFDDTLTQSKEAQLSNFIRQYFNYDPDKGDLPVATRELYYDNLQRLAYPFSSDPTYFYLDYYLENLNKEDFLNHSIYQASQMDGSKTQTELLFALQDIYHIQQRAWNYYFNFESLYKTLPSERKNRLRTETLKRVDERYQKVLKDKNIKNYREIRELYSKKRMEIMDYILEKSPDRYRRNDALFEKAAIEWEWGVESNDMQHLQNAIISWQQLTQSLTDPASPPSTNTEFLSRDALLHIAPLMQRFQATNNELEKRSIQMQIEQVLNSRFQDRLMDKRLREEKLLWPRNVSKNNSDNPNNKTARK